MQRKISCDGVTPAAKALSCVPFLLAGVMFAVQIYNRRLGILEALAGVALLAAYAWVIRRFVWRMIDEVTDCGDYLLVKRGTVEDKILLSDVEDVIDRPYRRPPKMIVKLRAKSEFGWNVAFAKVTGSDADGLKDIAADLRHRVRLATGRTFLP